MRRQIRRMCESVDLKRVCIGKVILANLPEGKWRYLHDDESFD
jgi:23S rRNA pseudouridine2604 synthase